MPLGGKLETPKDPKGFQSLGDSQQVDPSTSQNSLSVGSTVPILQSCVDWDVNIRSRSRMFPPFPNQLNNSCPPDSHTGPYLMTCINLPNSITFMGAKEANLSTPQNSISVGSTTPVHRGSVDWESRSPSGSGLVPHFSPPDPAPTSPVTHIINNRFLKIHSWGVMSVLPDLARVRSS
ncbi:hypothetical protein NXF25_011167 [Crotalus adamanteus]|uniref:Uncharacterized protein n=1 Tax=Crotalus adamanteus TaxID=8729 RepID=A0AAW1BEK6_CROAD